MPCPEATFRFKAIEDFTKKETFDERELSALSKGIRIMFYRNFTPRDLHAVSGPLFGFRLQIKKIIFGLHDSRTLFIREVVIPPNSNIELHYYDIARQEEYVAEVERHPGLNITFKSGYHHRLYDEVHIICTRDGGVMVLDRNGQKQYIL